MELRQSRWDGTAIRVCDIALSSALIVALAPLLIGLALAIRLSDGGPALFRQPRVGRGGAVFAIAKFRTMRVVPPVAAGEGSHRTAAGDPRVTTIGRMLRPSHLDELPQLFNVLIGDMSLVGVRPDTPMQEGDYPPAYWRARHAYAPGITGPAQVAGVEQTLAQRSAFEQQWLAGRSLDMYWRMLWQTIGKVFAASSH